MPRPYKSQNLSINPTIFKNIKILRNLNYTSLHHRNETETTIIEYNKFW